MRTHTNTPLARSLFGTLSAVTLLGLGILSAAALPGQQSTDSLSWLTDLEKAEKLAAKSGKPLLLVFR